MRNIVLIAERFNYFKYPNSFEITMISRKSIVLLYLVVFSMISIFFIVEDVSSKPVMNYVSNSEPIDISNNQDFVDLGFSGNGSDYNPFIIEDLIIITEEEEALSIEGVSCYFVIQNCTFQSVRTAALIGGSEHETFYLFNNTFQNSFRGALLFESCVVANNTIKNNDYGLSHVDGHNTLIENNTCINNKNYGISIFKNCKVRNNVFVNCGLSGPNEIWDAKTNTVEDNNIVNGQKLGYFVNESNMMIDQDDYGQIFLLNNSNVVVKNQNLSNAYIGIHVVVCSNLTLSNNVLSSGFFGLLMNTASNVKIMSNYISDNLKDGIHIYRSLSVHLFNNTFFRNSRNGLALVETFESIVEFNLFQSNTKYGVNIYSYFSFNYGSVLYHNSFFYNGGRSSQAYDVGDGNQWYNSTLKEGNFWLSPGFGSYKIAGEGNSKDLYPLKKPLHNPISETKEASVMHFIPIMFVSTVVYYAIVKRRRRNKK